MQLGKDGPIEKLQGSLYLPANYVKGKTYPTLVYIYEKLTNGHFGFTTPSANGFNKSVYTSNGYAVLMPDITYRVNDPGMSAVWCLTAAVKAAIATGVVDPKRIGLQGHSWGGYQTAFTVTQTDLFAAAIAGAPLTNMVSMYSLIYKNSGGGEHVDLREQPGPVPRRLLGQLGCLLPQLAGELREEREDAARHPAQRQGRRGRLHAGRRVLQHAPPPRKAGRHARVPGREPRPREGPRTSRTTPCG